MRSTILGLALAAATGVAAGPLGAHAETSAPQPVIHGPAAVGQEVLRQELAFEAKSEHDGASAAFAAFMDQKDGMEFTGGGPPVRGAQAIAEVQTRLLRNGTLSWAPSEIFVSTGDLAAVWGSWTFSTGAGARPATGRYVTVWRKTPQGEWKGLIDIGTPDS
jgi:ketosteroid isomerase-like protein